MVDADHLLVPPFRIELQSFDREDERKIGVVLLEKMEGLCRMSTAPI